MEEQPPGSGRVDELVSQLRARVEERRRRGEYPPGLEHDLDAHLRRIAAHRATPDVGRLRAAMAELEGRMGLSAERIGVTSGIPGGEAVHKAVAKVVARQTQGVLEQVQGFAEAVREVLGAVVAALEDPHGHVHADLVGQLDAVLDRLAAYERGPVESAAAVADLRRRVEDLEAESVRHFRPWYRSERFADEFRGKREELLERYRDLAERLRGCDPVLEIGCGRGEFLELLDAAGVQAAGVELDAELVDLARELGMDVRHGDGVRVLAGVEPASLGGVVLVQVVEHLSAQELVELVSLAHEKLRPGGRLLVETVNPQSLYVFAHAFYLDPTHTRPVHPAYLSFLLTEAGFADVEVEWRSPPPPEDVPEVAEGAAGDGAAAESLRRLNRLLFAPQDYAVVATR